MDATGLVLIAVVVALALYLSARKIRTLRQLLGLADTIDREGPEAAHRLTRELEEDTARRLIE